MERVAAPYNKSPTNEERTRYRVLEQETRAYRRGQEERITALEQRLQSYEKQSENASKKK